MAALTMGLLLACLPRVAAAHSGEPLAPHDLWAAWELAPLLLLGLGALALVYARAVRSLWRAAGKGRGLPVWRTAAFVGGLLLLAVALLSPLDALGGALFSAHMVQHVLLMMAAAPLLALGAPAHLWLWALPLAGRRGLARWWGRQPALRYALHWLHLPLVVWLASALTMWLWHIPAWYEAALQDETVHVLEHITFLGSAWLFWGLVLRPWRRSVLAEGTPILLLFTTALHSGILGALITFAPAPWYASYTATTAAWGLTPLADQQLAGVIMWVPGGMVYLGATLALIGRRLAQLERQDAPPRPHLGTGSLLPVEDGS
jgi:cytochrome c oxidase assembly factor CtaG